MNPTDTLIALISLGCDKNLVDSEGMLGQLLKKGFRLTEDEAEADVIIVNTCCFIDSAKEESINTILELAPYRTDGKCRALIVTGCLAERYRKEIAEELPEVDVVLGTGEYDRILETVLRLTDEAAFQNSHDGKAADAAQESASGTSQVDAATIRRERVLLSGGYSTYLKIAEGCDKCCTYCVIPKVRGHYRSFPMEELILEAETLAKRGIKELILVAQETTRYGVDLYKEKKLPELLRKLCKIDGIEWIRLLYCYPEEVTDELIDVIRTEPKICPYLDLPIQHCDDTVLKRMGRRTDKSDLLRIIKKLREGIPGLALRTTLISGFPGETEEQHAELVDFVRNMKFDRLGIFPYSQEEGTPAAKLPQQLPDEVKEERRDEIMALQQEISAEISASFVGRTLRVLVEGRMPEDDVYVGRSYRDAPDVDGYVFFTADRDIMSGEFVEVSITGSSEYDLTGEMIDESAE